MINEKKIITNNIEETYEVGREIASTVKDGGIILLFGDLGSGKTTLVQGAAKALGVKERVNSPTFLIMKQYKYRKMNSAGMLYHIDAYRLNNEREIEELGLAEVFANKGNIVFCEWAEKLGSFLPESYIKIECEFIEGDKRKYLIKEIN